MCQRRFPWNLLILSFALPAVLSANTSLHVDESKTQLQIGASESCLKFAVRGVPTGGPAVRVDLELLDPKDRIVKGPLARLNSDGRIQPN